MTVKRILHGDKAGLRDVSDLWNALALELWDEEDDIYDEFEESSGTDKEMFFAVYSKDEKPVGFGHCSIRTDYVEGKESDAPVGYLEGIYVKPAWRGRGIARMIVDRCIEAAKERGCSEFASDCELDNTDSYNFHISVGFAEANRTISFIRKI
jgi:aminoglycoside 6'-N-acetyltransferase I